MSKIKTLLTVIFVTVLFNVPLKSQQLKADRGFELYRFKEVIPLYKQVFEKAKEDKRSYLAQRIGDCYRLINNPDSAVLWYKESTLYPGLDPMSYFYLGEALRAQDDYKEAFDAFLRFDSLAPEDPRGSLFASYCSLILDHWNNLPSRYWVRSVDSINTEYSEFGPTLYSQGIVFASDRSVDSIHQKTYEWTGRNYLNLFYSSVSDFDSIWDNTETPKFTNNLGNQLYHNGPAFFTNDSLYYVTRTDKEQVPTDFRKIRTYRLKIYWRSLRQGDDNNIIPFPYNSDEYSVAHPFLDSDSQKLYFSSDMEGGYGGMDLYFCSKDENGIWDEPINLGSEVNSPGNEVFPYLRNDSTLYFSSDYFEGYGGLDIFKVLLKYDTLWMKRENMKRPINSSWDDFGILFLNNSSEYEGLISSSRRGGLGSDDIYAFQKKYYLNGYVKDKRTMEPIPGSYVFLLNSNNLKVQVVETDSLGRYHIPVIPETPYEAKAIKPYYIDDCYSFSFSISDTSIIIDAPRDLLLDKLQIEKVVVMDNIYYDFDKWDIRDDAKVDLDWLVRIMKKNDIKVELGAHTDSRGTNSYNRKLSQRRAESAVNYIVNKGIDPSRLIAKGYGESELVNQCSNGVRCTPAEHQANRRTEFKVLGFLSPDNEAGEDISNYISSPIIGMDQLPEDFFSSCLGRQSIETTSERVLNSGDSKDRLPGYYSPPEEDGCYGVKILSNSDLIDLNDPLWSGLTKKNWYFDGEMYHYLVGCTSRELEAYKLLNRMKLLGYNNASVVRLNANGLTKVD